MKITRITLHLFILIVAAFLVSQCKSKTKGEFNVTVKYKNLNRMMARDKTGRIDTGSTVTTTRILLEEIPFGGDMTPVILDSVTLTNNNGEVELKGNGTEEAVFQLVVEKGPMLLLVNDEENISIDIDLSKRDNYYTVSGSKATTDLKEFIRQYSDKTLAVNNSFESLDSMKQLGASDSSVISGTQKKNSDLTSLNKFLQDFIDRSTHPALSLFALGWSSRSFPQAEFEKSLDDVVRKFPDHNTLKTLKSTYDLQKQQLAEQEKKQVQSSRIGKPAPDLNMPDADGKAVSITSFRGKYLLVDFWASWCGPCRQENPNVVKAFNRYKDKNFTILGVSLDKEKDPWLKAVKDDQLDWTQMSDLKYWDSKAVEVYRFEGIPYNVLIDPKGNVIAENLRGFDLEKKLAEVLE